jgi:GTP-binding protein
VGKSTLFNRITGTRRAIVAPVAGTTRDFLSAPAEWRGATFLLVDTGGMFGASQDPLHELVFTHGRRALDTADLVVFVVDGREGLVPGDAQIAETLRALDVPVLLAVNKTDDKRAAQQSMEFFRFGFDPVFEVSAEHGTGVAELLDEVVERTGALRPPQPRPEGGDGRGDGLQEVRVAIVGRPNVGKSSLVNRLLREERVLVSDVPGTTRDAIDSVLRWQKRTFRIIDTAGIRRPGRVAKSGQVEAVSVLVARRNIEQADVAVLVLDAVEGATDQDGAIAGEAERTGCGVIIAANKWDLTKGRGEDFVRTFDEKLRRDLKFLEYAPVLHISALTGERTGRLLEVIDAVSVARRKRVPTAELNRFLEAVTSSHPPASPGKKEVRILYGAQTGIEPPTFVLFTNVATRFHFSYQRFLVNRLRDAFGFQGTPLRIHVRKRGGKG